jgi:hypothetical protein
MNLADLSLSDLHLLVNEHTAYCLDTCHRVGQPARAASLRILRAELRRRVLEIVSTVAPEPVVTSGDGQRP